MKWLRCWIIAAAFLTTAPATAALWDDATELTIGETDGWSNKVELADVDGDGLVDIVFANGGNYASSGTPELNRVFLNGGPGQPFVDVSQDVFGKPDSARVIKVRDLNADGVPDIVVGTTWQTRSRLFLGLGAAEFVEVTETHTPPGVGSVGDIDIGDVDGDGDLDMVLADWGTGNPQNNDGGKTTLWLNNGFGAFTAAPTQMPDVLVRWSWDLELVDVDNDFDLDVVVSCKSCSGSKLFLNDGDGVFSDASDSLPQFTNNYDFEVMDIDGDGDMDLVTINDGPGLTEHVFVNDGAGVFSDETEALWPAAANVGEDDNALVFFDHESDGDADFLIGSLSGDDRLLVNDGAGVFSLVSDGFSAQNTPGTLGILVADLNGDHRPDVVQAQGEAASSDKVYFGADIAQDSAAPTIGPVTEVVEPGVLVLRTRVHDRKTPVMNHDFTSVEVRWTPDGGDLQATPLIWFGEALWTARLETSEAALTYSVCAVDAADNERCTEPVTVAIEPPLPADDGPTADAGPVDPDAGAEVERVETEGAEVEGAERRGAEVVAGAEVGGEDVSGAEIEPGASDAGEAAADSGGTGSTTGSDSGGCTSAPLSGGSPAALWLILCTLALMWHRPTRHA